MATMPNFKSLVRAPVSKIIDFPEYDDSGRPIAQVMLKVLSEGAHEEVQIAATKETAKKLKDDNIDPKGDMYKDLYESLFINICSRHILFKMCFDPENTGMTFFDTPDDVKKLSQLQIEYFNVEYQKLRDGHPYFSMMTDEDFEKKVEEFYVSMDKGADFLEHRLLSGMQINFTLYLIRELWKSRQRADGQSLMLESLRSLPSNNGKKNDSSNNLPPSQNQ